MPAKVFSEEEVGAEIQLQILAELGNMSKQTKEVPGLAVIVVGENPAFLSTAHRKKKLGEALGFHVELCPLPSTATTEEICTVIRCLNKEERFHGLFCQLPLLDHLSKKVIQAAIVPTKDVGGVHPLNAGKLWSETGGYLPCSASGCLEALKFTKEKVCDKTAVLLGNSNTLSKPLALLLLQKDVTVTLCPTLTADLPKICRDADLLVTEIGKPGLIKSNWINPGAIIIDAGVSQQDGVLKGDVAIKEVAQIAGWILPLSVKEMGALTLTMLLKNTLEAFKKKIIR